MIRSRFYIFLGVMLCLVTCLCAADAVVAGSEDNKTKAEDAVKELKNLTATVLKSAEMNHNEAKKIKMDVESQNETATCAQYDTKAAAEAITAEQRKTEASELANKAKTELDQCIKFYQNAKDKAEKALNGMDGFLTRALNLSNKSITEIPPIADRQDNYEEVIQSTAAVKTLTITLNGEINASTLLSDAKNELVTLTNSAKQIQVFKYQAESIAIVSQIEANMSEAKVYIQSIEQKKDLINTTVHEVDTICKSTSTASNDSLKSLCDKAKLQLDTASITITEAQDCNAKILNQKEQLDTTLATLKSKNDESEAKTQATTIVSQAKNIVDNFDKIKQALQKVETSLSSAKTDHAQMLTIISTQNSKSDSELKKKQQNGDVTTAGMTNTIQSSETKTQEIHNTDKTVITETEKTVFGKSEDSMVKSSDQPMEANLDNTKENKSTELMHDKNQTSKDEKSKLLNNDKLRNITKNMTNNTIMDGKVPKLSAANDSAMTISIPLLVILVVSAVLH